MDGERVPDAEVAEELPRGRRKRPGKRSLVFHAEQASRADVEHMKREPYPEDVQRPVTRGDCLNGGINEQRPCVFVGCKWNLRCDVSRIGSLQINRPEVEIEAMPESCALDVAERDGVTLEEIGAIFGVSRERIRQIEAKAMERASEDLITLALANDIEPRMRDRRGSKADCIICSREFRRDPLEFQSTCPACIRGEAPPKPSTEIALPMVSREEQLRLARAAGQSRGPAPTSMAYEAKGRAT